MSDWEKKTKKWLVKEKFMNQKKKIFPFKLKKESELSKINNNFWKILKNMKLPN